MPPIFQSTRRSRRHRQSQTPEGRQEQQTPFFGKSDGLSDVQGKPQPFFQAKLAIGQPGDPYEREADAVADAVVNHKGQAPVVQRQEISTVQRESLAAPQEEKEPVQMQTIGEEEEPIQMQAEGEEEPVQMKSKSGGSTASTHLSSRIQDAAGKGQPLPSKTRAEMESSFGLDFKGVNIHTDNEAVQMNQELGAQAFTHGKDVYFNSGKFRPENSEGKHLLAHELTHVVQQGGGQRQVQRAMGDGHDLTHPLFAGDEVLEACFDGEKSQYLKLGSQGLAVEKVQQALTTLGFFLPLFNDPTHTFDERTAESVSRFKKAHGLFPDPVVGKGTISKLNELMSKSDPPEPNPSKKAEEIVEVERTIKAKFKFVFFDYKKMKFKSFDIGDETKAIVHLNLPQVSTSVTFPVGSVVKLKLDLLRSAELELGHEAIKAQLSLFQLSLSKIRIGPLGVLDLSMNTVMAVDFKKEGSELGINSGLEAKFKAGNGPLFFKIEGEFPIFLFNVEKGERHWMPDPSVGLSVGLPF